MKSNIDDAFTRRFQSIIHFPPPTKEERKRIWEIALSDSVLLSNETKLNDLAEAYELTPASIVAVTDSIKIKLATKRQISNEQLEKMIQVEYDKLIPGQKNNS